MGQACRAAALPKPLSSMHSRNLVPLEPQSPCCNADKER